jgi:hypothetical protein
MPRHPVPLPGALGQYVTRPQLERAGVASRSTFQRAARDGSLVPVGRRGHRGPSVYLVADVERWLRGEPSDARPAPPPPMPPRRRSSESSTSSDALRRIEAAAAGGRR